MPCFKPLTAYRTDHGEITFAERGAIHSTVILACGQCIGCRLERSRQWAVRCMHEAQMHKFNSFLTLTYADEYLPNRYTLGWKTNSEPIYSGTLSKVDHQKFIKRLRKALGRVKSSSTSSPYLTTLATNAVRPCGPVSAKVRYYLGAEYGTQYGRPHYHICLFGVDFADKKYWMKTPAGSRIYRSPELERLWPFGHSTVGVLNFESAAYTARYVMKKITGDRKEKAYERLDRETGEIIRIEPEYNEPSRRPGIGLSWLEKYTADVYPKGKVIVRGKEANPPRYYDKQIAKWDPDVYELIQHDRHIEGSKRWEDQTDARLKVREEVQAAKLRQLKRNI